MELKWVVWIVGISRSVGVCSCMRGRWVAEYFVLDATDCRVAVCWIAVELGHDGLNYVSHQRRLGSK